MYSHDDDELLYRGKSIHKFCYQIDEIVEFKDLVAVVTDYRTPSRDNCYVLNEHGEILFQIDPKMGGELGARVDESYKKATLRGDDGHLYSVKNWVGCHYDESQDILYFKSGDVLVAFSGTTLERTGNDRIQRW